jgi:radical SAM protein with 4Fe4S-binding SPASM domain
MLSLMSEASLGEKIGLLRGLWSRERVFAGPFVVTLDVTRRCNLQCVGCRTHSPWARAKASSDPVSLDVDVEMVSKLCREMKSAGARKLVFCGRGEALLHSRFLELVGLAKASGLNTVLITNGTLIDEPMAEALVDSGLDLLRVSFWGTSREALEGSYPGTKPEYIRAVPALVRRLVSIRQARGARLPRVVMHMILTRLSGADLAGFVESAVEMQADAVSFSPLHSIQGPLAELAPTGEEERELILQLRRVGRRLRSARLEENTEETIRRYEAGPDAPRAVSCYIPWTHPRVAVDGTVYPCDACEWPLGNLHSQSLSEVWNGPAYRSFRRHVLSPSGPDFLAERCDCSYCCHFASNERIHRVYRWIAPLARVGRS